MSKSEYGKGGRPRYVLPARDPRLQRTGTAGLPSISIALRALPKEHALLICNAD